MNDAGKVAFTPKGDYSSTVTYEYLDTVVYNGNAYAALKTTTGNAPTDSDTDENWKLLARGGTSVPIATEEIAGVVKAGSDVGVSDTGDMVLKTDFTKLEEPAELTSGENRSTFFGKIAKAVADFILHKSTEASTTDYGHTILEDSIESTSTDKAATSASVKKAYDLANEAVPTANISQSSAITETGMHVLDAVEKNASVEGTLAHDIAELNSNLATYDYFEGTFATSFVKIVGKINLSEYKNLLLILNNSSGCCLATTLIPISVLKSIYNSQSKVVRAATPGSSNYYVADVYYDESSKLDICNSMQKFFGMHIPVFLDGGESLNIEYFPKMDCQLIVLSVSDDKELKFEYGENN